MNKIYVVGIIISILIVGCSIPVMADDLIEQLYIKIEHYGPPEDINENGEVEVTDISLLVGSWGQKGVPGWIREDINDDGEVEVTDISRLVGAWKLKWLTENP